jgi:hypothetical protein
MHEGKHVNQKGRQKGSLHYQWAANHVSKDSSDKHFGILGDGFEFGGRRTDPAVTW